jgi:hypothetical protein
VGLRQAAHGAAALGATLTASAATTPKPMLKTVSATALAQAGIRLRPPTSSAVVSRAAAQQAALRASPAGPTSAVREAVLADFSDTNHVPPIHALAWVFSLTIPPGFRAPSAGPPGNPPPKAPSYLVVFIDAGTGAFVEGLAAS